MGGKDHCAVYGCSNNRKYPERLTKMPHVGILRWHGPKSLADAMVWNQALNRGGNFQVTMRTKVCSNHFKAGYCSDICRIPTLYLKGYVGPHAKRIRQRKRLQSSRKRRVTVLSDIFTADELVYTPPPEDHQYAISNLSSCVSRHCPVNFDCSECNKYRNDNILKKKQNCLTKRKKFKNIENKSNI